MEEHHSPMNDEEITDDGGGGLGVPSPEPTSPKHVNQLIGPSKDEEHDPTKRRKLLSGFELATAKLALSGTEEPLVRKELDDTTSEDSEDDDDDFETDPAGDWDRKKTLSFEFRIDNFREKREEILKSEAPKVVSVRGPSHTSPDGFSFGMLVFPNGLMQQNSASWGSHLSVFIEIRDTDKLREKHGVHWREKRSYCISVVNHKVPVSTSKRKRPRTAASAPEPKPDLKSLGEGKGLHDKSGDQKSSGEEATMTDTAAEVKPPGGSIPAKTLSGPPASNGAVTAADLTPKKVYKHMKIEACDVFEEQHTDWGFATLIPLASLTEESGYLDKNGSLLLRATVTPPLSWSDYSCKEVTGKVGLENDGATCYLNSLLQTLYMTKALRLAIYDLDTSQDKRNSHIGLELQRLFHALQTRDHAVSTRQLTMAFGWDSHLLFRQHDVQEMNRELVDKLETRMEGSKQAGLIKKLYTGVTRSYINCINVDFESKRDEEFYDIQLDVKNMKNVYQAFEKYVEEEKLEGDNQYEAEGFGKQDANKGIGFMSFPPVLTLHLKRFEYDMMSDATIKINDRFKFPTRLDLNRFLHKDVVRTETSPQYKYVLHSVLVHVGDVNAGHYYAFINDIKRKSDDEIAKLPVDADPLDKYEQQWLRFDDERVTIASRRLAVSNNYGGNQRMRHGLSPSVGNAYMLVYIQLDHLDEVLPPVPDSRVPKTLLDRFDRDMENEKREAEENERRLNSIKIRIATEEDIAQNTWFGRSPSSFRRYVDFVYVWTLPELQIRKDDPATLLYDKVAEMLGLSSSDIRLWPCVDRENLTHRPDVALEVSNTAVKEKINVGSDGFGVVFVEKANATASKPTGSTSVLTGIEEKSSATVPPADAETATLPDPDLHDLAAKEVNESTELAVSPTSPQADSTPRVGDLSLTNDGAPCANMPPAVHHSLIFWREWRPSGTCPEEKLPYIGFSLISQATLACDVVENYLAPLLRLKGEKNPSIRVQDYQISEMLTPKDAPVIPGMGDRTPFIDKNQLQNGDILIFERIHDKVPDVELPEKPVPSTEVVEEDGVLKHHFVNHVDYKNVDEYLRFLDSRLELWLLPFDASPAEKPLCIELQTMNRYDTVVDLVAKALIAAKHPRVVGKELENGKRLRLYRSNGPFQSVDQARPKLQHVLPKQDLVYRKMVFDGLNKSIWLMSSDAPASHRDRPTLFFEVLPCNISQERSLFEVHVLKHTYPNYTKELLLLQTPAFDAKVEGFKDLRRELATRIHVDEEMAPIRWICLKRNIITHIFDGNEEADPRDVLPDFATIRSTNPPTMAIVADVVQSVESEREGLPLAKLSGPHHKSHVIQDPLTPRLVIVRHFFSPKPEEGIEAKRYGRPFTLVVSPTDTAANILANARWRLGIDEIDIKDWKIAAFKSDNPMSTFELMDPESKVFESEVLYPTPTSFSKVYAVLGLLHINSEETSSYDEEQSSAQQQPERRRYGGRSPMISDASIARFS